MRPRHLSLIVLALMLPALAACSRGDAGPPPLSKAADAAVVAEPGIPRETFARAADALFSDHEAGETRALIVISGGKIIAERYGNGFDRTTRQVSWSMAKTVTGVMIGMLIADGRLRLDEAPPVPLWQRPGDPRGAITLRELLQMRSGLRHTEAGDPIYDSSEVRMLFLDGRDNMAAWAEEQPLDSEPGKAWKYSSATSVILADLAARSLSDTTDPVLRRQAVADFLRTRLFDPVGMKSAVPEFDAAGTLIGSSLIHATARDWGKFGEFLRNGGAVKGAQLVPRGWIDFMTSPAPGNPGYGAQVWLNRPQADGDTVLFPGKGPPGIFACIGHLGQYVIVSPRQNLTVVRLGKSSGEERKRVLAHLAEIVGQFPVDQK